MRAGNMFWCEFLEMYKLLPVLWDVKNENYYNRVEKEAAYDKLVDKLKTIDPNAHSRTVKSKINTFRTNYRRELNKMKKVEKSGVDEVYESSLWYFELLHFLTDQDEPSKTKSNMSYDDNVSDSDSCHAFEPPVKRKIMKEDEILKTTCEKLKDSSDAVMAKIWASQYADNLFWSEFLEMYKSLPVLWEVKNKNYSNRVEKEAAYDQLVDKLKEIDPEADIVKVKKKINTFRTNFRRELKKTEKSNAGDDDVYQSNLWYFDLLLFLTEQEEHSMAKVERYISDDDSVSDMGIEEFDLPVKQEIMKEDIIDNMTCEKSKESSDAISVLAEGWASQYAELGNEQRVLARRIWADVLFYGCMNRLTENMVEDVHHVLKGNSNTSNPTPASVRSLTPTPYDEEYSYSPQPKFTFVAYEQNDDAQISAPIKNEQCSVVRQNSFTDLPSTSATNKILPSQSIITKKKVNQRSSPTPTNLKEYIVSFAIDNENQNVLNNPDDIEEHIEEEEEEYEDILYEIDDDAMMESIEHEDDSHDELNNGNLCQKPEENHTPNATEVAVSILNHIRDRKLKSSTRRKFINWQKLNADECRELKRLLRRRDYICDQCGRHFADSSNLKLHILRHSGIKNYECKECNVKFYTPHLLKRHSLMHKNSHHMFICQYCNKYFLSDELRLQHERSHFKDRPFPCDQCDKSFFTKAQQKEHNLVHTRIRKYNCELCNQHFMRGQHLRRHYRSQGHKKREQQRK